MKLVINVENKDFENKILLLDESSDNINEILKLINRKKDYFKDNNKMFVYINCGEGVWSFFLGNYFKNTYCYETDKNKLKLLKKNKVLMEQEENVKLFNYEVSNKKSNNPKSYLLDEFKLRNIGLIKITESNKSVDEEINKTLEGMHKTLKANKFPSILIEIKEKSQKIFDSLLKLKYKPVEELTSSLILYQRD